jgi:hypothetical protein
MRYITVFTFLLLFSLPSAFSQNGNIWEFVGWEMKLKQVQDSLHDRQIDYTYQLNDGKGAFIKVSVTDYQGWAVDFFFSLSTQELYQLTTKKKFTQNDTQKAEKELIKVSEYLREAWGAPIKEVEEKTAPFCQYEYVWQVENTKISLTSCRTTTTSLTVNYLKNR